MKNVSGFIRGWERIPKEKRDEKKIITVIHYAGCNVAGNPQNMKAGCTISNTCKLKTVSKARRKSKEGGLYLQ